MLELLAPYKFAIEQDSDFRLARVPIFRTDSLSVEIDKGREVAPTLLETEKGLEFPVNLPLRSDTSPKLVFKLPSWKELGGLIDNADQYYAATLALFDLLRSLIPESVDHVSTELLQRFMKVYLANKDFRALAEIYRPYADINLSNIRKILTDWGNGRLIKSIEDSVLSTLIKAYITFDFVVGNPPWVSKQTKKSALSESYQFDLIRNYVCAVGDFDLHVVFIEKGLRLLRKGGVLGFIVSSTFAKQTYGETIRAVIVQNKLKELIDFTDYDVFEGATNLSTIIVVQKETEGELGELYRKGVKDPIPEVLCVRVSNWPEHDLPNLVSKIRSLKENLATQISGPVDIFKIPYSEFSARVLSQKGKVALVKYTTRKNLGSETKTIEKMHPLSDVWIIAPPEELALLYKMEDATTRRLAKCDVIRNGLRRSYTQEKAIATDINQGLIASGKEIYVVRSIDNLSIEEIQRRKEITVVPKGVVDKEFTMETELLRFLIDGRNIERWHFEWAGELLIVPYAQKGDRFELITSPKLQSSYPRLFEYFTDPDIIKALTETSGEREKIFEEMMKRFSLRTLPDLSETLRHAQNLTDLTDDLTWYRFMRRQNLEILGKVKILLCTTSNETKFSPDVTGVYAPHNVRVYSISIDSEKMMDLLGILNSKAVEFYLNHISVLKKGKTFEYLKQGLSTLPIPINEDERARVETIKSKVSSILSLLAKAQHMKNFPSYYLHSKGALNIEFDMLEYRASSNLALTQIALQQGLSGDGRPSLVLSKRETLASPFIDTVVKADYVMEALSGKKLAKGQLIRIPIPRSDDICKEVLARLEQDRKILASADIEALEEEVNELVFQLYRLAESDKKIIDDYLQKF